MEDNPPKAKKTAVFTLLLLSGAGAAIGVATNHPGMGFGLGLLLGLLLNLLWPKVE